MIRNDLRHEEIMLSQALYLCLANLVLYNEGGVSLVTRAVWLLPKIDLFHYAHCTE